MKIISWNVNGLRAIMAKDITGERFTRGQQTNNNVLSQLIHAENPDILAIQEIRCDEDVATKFALEHFPEYHFHKVVSSKKRKGYSGVAIFSKTVPQHVYDDFPENEEGRVICLEFPNYFVINAYVPNSKPDLSRLKYRVEVWEPAIRTYINKMNHKKKPVVYVGDFNVAPTELDIARAKENEKSHGYTIEERTAFADLLKGCGMIDAYRVLHPNQRQYTWFSNYAKSRERNIGWFIDRIIVSQSLKKHISSISILPKYFGSDHVPIQVTMAI